VVCSKNLYFSAWFKECSISSRICCGPLYTYELSGCSGNKSPSSLLNETRERSYPPKSPMGERGAGGGAESTRCPSIGPRCGLAVAHWAGTLTRRGRSVLSRVAGRPLSALFPFFAPSILSRRTSSCPRICKFRRKFRRLLNQNFRLRQKIDHVAFGNLMAMFRLFDFLEAARFEQLPQTQRASQKRSLRYRPLAKAGHCDQGPTERSCFAAGALNIERNTSPTSEGPCEKASPAE